MTPGPTPSTGLYASYLVRFFAASLVLALFSGACGSAAEPAGSTAEPFQQTTRAAPTTTSAVPGARSDLIDLRAANGFAVPLDAALDLFSSVFGQIPGGDPTRFEVRPGDGTLAIRKIGAHWPDLTSEQQQAVFGRLGHSEVQSLRGPSTSVPQRLIDDVNDVRSAISSHLGRELPLPIAVGIDRDLDALAAVQPQRDGRFAPDGIADECLVVFPAADPSRNTIAHEVFHCFQVHLAGDVATFNGGPDWIYEGSAEWVGARVGGNDDSTHYLYEAWGNSTSSLFALDYAAIGFFWVIESMGVDPWTVIGPMLSAEGEAAVATAGLDESDLLRRMASSPLRRSIAPTLDVSTAWDFTPADVPEIAIRRLRVLAPGSSASESISLQSFAKLPPLRFELRGGLIATVTATADVGLFEFVDGPSEDWVGEYEAQFCVREGGCSCGADGVDSQIPRRARDFVLAMAERDGGPVTYRVDLAESGIGFTDGHWEGELTTWYDSAPRFSQPIEFTVLDGAVVEGSYAETQLKSDPVAAIVTIRGSVAGCGYSPRLLIGAIDVDIGTGVQTPVTFDFHVDRGEQHRWIIDGVTDADRRSGEVRLDPGATITFDLVRTGDT